MTIRLYLEEGSKRSFACAVDWPGWARSGKAERHAVEAFLDYAPRFARIVEPLGLGFPSDCRSEIVERIPGTSTTDFGAPGVVPEIDRVAISFQQAERNAAIVEAIWVAFEETVATSPTELRKGPRGSGRDRDEMAAHVYDAEVAYVRKLGIRPPPDEPDADQFGYRDAVLDVLRSTTDPEPLVAKGWPVGYTARRIAWHSLDHLWEMEDRRS